MAEFHQSKSMIVHCMEGLMSFVNITRILDPVLMNPIELYLLATCIRARRKGCRDDTFTAASRA